MEGALQVAMVYLAHIPLHEAQPSSGATLLQGYAEEPAARDVVDADLLGDGAGQTERRGPAPYEGDAGERGLTQKAL